VFDIIHPSSRYAMSEKGESWSEGRSREQSRSWSSTGQSRTVSIGVSISRDAAIDPHGEATIALLKRMMRERLDGEEFSDGAGI
jgi:hypothetical protein